MSKRRQPLTTLRERAKALKAETYALLLASRDPRVPWYAKALAAAVVAYAFSPLDLVPDFIPVLGYLDDLILVPLGLALAIRLIPREVMSDARARAANELQRGKPTNWLAGAAVIAVWLLLLSLSVVVALRLMR
jgi:uncharacterized membrane protein YkvA (DUF1232 family)